MTPQPEGAELEVRRIVPGAPERVFDTWTSPTAMLDWWAPPGGRCTDAQVDLRVGGRYRIVNLLVDSSTVIISGQYLEVTRPDSLSYTWSTDATQGPTEQVTVRFKAHVDGTEVVVSHQRIAGPELLEGHETGWANCLNGLARHLARTERAGSD